MKLNAIPLSNYHSHTQFCDGHASMEEMAAAAARAGFEVWGFSPHSPLNIPSPCNMKFRDVPLYLDEVERLCKIHHPSMRILAGMEIDYISPEFGPHIEYFRRLPLDHRIGSVHFVPSQKGVWVDCDGRPERFKRYLHEFYEDDLQYVVETYFHQVLAMIERGGFDILGHPDKIASNASAVNPDIENESWYEALIDDVLEGARAHSLTVEINTKSARTNPDIDPRTIEEVDMAGGRFFPARRWWGKLGDINTVADSDAHWPDRLNVNLTRILQSGKCNS